MYFFQRVVDNCFASAGAKMFIEGVFQSRYNFKVVASLLWYIECSWLLIKSR